MGKIEKIIKKGPVEGQTTEVYPVTSTKAIYDENNKRLDNIITGLQESVSGELNTTSKKIVPAINEVNTLAKSKGNGTITEVRMNGASKGTSGVVDLGTVITSHQDISGKADKSAAIGSLSLSLDSTNYKITLSGTKVDGTTFTVSDVIDLPLESVVVNGSYNNTTKKVVLTLQSGSTVEFSVADLVSGLQSEITSTNKLSADLIADGTTNKVVTASEKTTWNGKQDALTNADVLTGITSTKVSNWDNAATNSHTHSNKSVLDGISSTDITNWNSKTNNVGTVTGVKMNGTTNNPTNGVVDLGTVITAHQDISGKQDKLISGTNIKTINGESVIGSGDITINSAYPEVNHGTGDTTFTLTPNTFHVWDRVPSLTLDFGSKTSGVMNEYLFQFKSGTTATSLTLPNSIKWVNGSVPTIKPKMIYQVNILNGLANVLEFSSTFNVNNYLTIEALEDNLTATFTNDVEYAIDGDEWVKLASGSATQPINVGQTLSFRGEFTPNSSNGIGTFTINKKCNLKGNCMSMLFGDNASDNYSLSGKNYAFYKLFYNCKNIVNVSSNFLPATTLADSCYRYMFYGCTSLTTAPELPATTLAMGCYTGMFWNCTSLTTAPELPATTLADSCYYAMFRDCTSLTTAPELPAATLAMGCYTGMFWNCTPLTTAPALPATTLAEYCYEYMFYGCTSLTTAPELPAATLANHCYSNMFQDCTKLTTAPELPATTLANYCYDTMFQDCTSLTTAPSVLPATTLASNCYSSMFYGCTSLTTAPELPATTLADSCYYAMFRDCTSLTTAPTLPSTILANYCYSNMFQGCTSLTTASALPATTLALFCYSSMFAVCTSLTTAPELPATTLVNNCYSNMFYKCTKLNYIKCLATNISATGCTNNWVNGVASTGTFVQNPNMTSWTTGADGIPTGWTVQNA